VLYGPFGGKPYGMSFGKTWEKSCRSCWLRDVKVSPFRGLERGCEGLIL